MLGLPMPKETGLQKSWLTGPIRSTALFLPVVDARIASIGNESDVRALRDSLEKVFERWRNENGIFPEGGEGLLLLKPYEGKPLEECPPYKCAGSDIWDYPGLLAKLRAEQYPPLMELEAEADNLCNPPPTLPDHIPRLPATATKLGMQRILAALILSEAAAGNIESTAKVHLQLSIIQGENQRRVDEGMRAGNQMMYTLAVFALPFKRHSDIKRKPSPIRKLIARELAKNPTLKPLQLWAILASKPPKGFSFFENSLGKYIEIEGRKDMGWSRFSRVCKEEKDKLIT